MINTITGKVIEIGSSTIVVQMGGLGFSFSLSVPMSTKYILDKEAFFYTYMHWNQEQGPTLFGFDNKEERVLFVTLIGCSGVGPKMALSALGHLGVSGFIAAVQQADIKALSTVNGIGAKKAEQIIVQLKHKLDKILGEYDFSTVGGFAHTKQIKEVLISLNYSSVEILKAVEHVINKNTDQEAVFDVALRQALSFLSKNV